MKPYDILTDIKSIKSPTLVIHGNDDVIPLISSEHIHDAISSSELVRIEYCGHFPFVEQPDTFFKTIDTFMKK